MNNNNRGNNNNRRRGRGNNRQQGGGGQQVNRIDSRARGNAPQLLEKYRKMAHDAHLNGDRVTEEYYLQFADHYFRVLADQRVRQDEQRQNRPGQEGGRWQEGGDNDRFDGDGGEYGAEPEYPTPPYNYSERRGDREEPAPRNETRSEARAETRSPPPSEEREAAAAAPPSEPAPAEAPNGNAGMVYEPTENPFVRDNRGQRGLKPRRPRREDAPQPGNDAGSDAASSQLDFAVLPPAISPREEAPAEAAEAEAKPKRRAPRRKPAPGDGDEPLTAAG